MNKKILFAAPLLFLFFLSPFHLFSQSVLETQKKGEAPASFNVEKAIADGNHKALAEYYRAQAESYRQKAALHERMAEKYGPPLRFKNLIINRAQHCRVIAYESEKTAKKYEELAVGEEKLIQQK